ncbi:putative phage tail protein [Gorillibacterium sp. sgz5001074]|uniref:putative phage tail protein n=1 Tax=Gorillibacterium sp. sgz5001074 TaxID=3446695 RepID=UPI003F6721A7
MIRDKVKSYISPVYAMDMTTSGILDSGADELEELETGITSVLQQFFVDTATWALTDWEQELQIKTDESKPISERRSVIKSRLRGSGTVTVALLESVAESYDRGRIKVTEQPALYQITIRFLDTAGIPPQIDDLMAAVESVKPAHLSVVYEYNYFLFSELDAKGWTFAQLDALGLTFSQWEVQG